MNKLKSNLSLINSVTSPAKKKNDSCWYHRRLFYLNIINLTTSYLCPLKMSAKPSDFSVISCKNRSLEFCAIFKCLVSLKADANASNILSNIENFWCWKKCKMHLRACKIYKKEKRRQKSSYTILDDLWSRSNFSSNIFWFIKPDFHVECICVQFHPTFGFSSLCWVQSICSVFQTFLLTFNIDIQMSMACGVQQKTK